MTSIAEGRLSQRITWLVLIAALAVTTSVMIAAWPLGPDYYYTYQPVSQSWLRGETRLYDTCPGRLPSTMGA